jgi:hypothetical protein
MEPGAVQRLQGRGIGSVELQTVLPILPVVLVASLFADLERALHLTGYATPWVPFWVL